MGAKPPLFCTGEAGQNFSKKAFFAGRAGVPVWANRTVVRGHFVCNLLRGGAWNLTDD